MQPAANRFSEFVSAQDDIYATVLEELRAGEKRSHWMWFIFPQLEGFGRSPMARKFAIHSKDEALAYLTHAQLGPRLLECTQLVLTVNSHSAHEIFGSPDDMKFHSSMTLFSLVSAPDSLFHQALAKYFKGRPDTATLYAVR